MVKDKTREELLVGAVGALRTFTRDDGKIELKKQRFHLDWSEELWEQCKAGM